MAFIQHTTASNAVSCCHTFASIRLCEFQSDFFLTFFSLPLANPHQVAFSSGCSTRQPSATQCGVVWCAEGAVTPPPFAQTQARFWFQDQKCGDTGSPCLDKPVLARGTYCGTQVVGIAQP